MGLTHVVYMEIAFSKLINFCTKAQSHLIGTTIKTTDCTCQEKEFGGWESSMFKQRMLGDSQM